MNVGVSEMSGPSGSPLKTEINRLDSLPQLIEYAVSHQNKLSEGDWSCLFERVRGFGAQEGAGDLLARAEIDYSRFTPDQLRVVIRTVKAVQQKSKFLDRLLLTFFEKQDSSEALFGAISTNRHFLSDEGWAEVLSKYQRNPDLLRKLNTLRPPVEQEKMLTASIRNARDIRDLLRRVVGRELSSLHFTVICERLGEFKDNRGVRQNKLALGALLRRMSQEEGFDKGHIAQIARFYGRLPSGVQFNFLEPFLEQGIRRHIGEFSDWELYMVFQGLRVFEHRSIGLISKLHNSIDMRRASPQVLAGLVHLEGVFELAMMGDTLKVVKERLGEFKDIELVEVMAGLSKVNYLVSTSLLDPISQRIASSAELEESALLESLVAFGNCRYLPRALLDRLWKAELSPWYQVYLLYSAVFLLGEEGEEYRTCAAKLLDHPAVLDQLYPQDRTWFIISASLILPQRREELLQLIVKELKRPLTLGEKGMLFQACLFLNEHEVPSELQVRQEIESSSLMHKAVERKIQERFATLKFESEKGIGYSAVDIFFPNLGDKGVVLEVDGPFHRLRNVDQETGRAKAKHRTIREMGYDLIVFRANSVNDPKFETELQKTLEAISSYLPEGRP